MPERQPAANDLRAPRIVAANRTFLPTPAPASWQIRAMARSMGNAREARTPDVAQAARWSLCVQCAAARTVAGAEQQWQAQAAKDEDAEERAGHGKLVPRQEDSENSRRMGPSLLLPAKPKTSRLIFTASWV